MAYNSQITRSSSNPPAYVSDDASALIPEDYAHDIMKGVTVKSAALQLFKHRTMSRKQQRIPVLATKPSAYWVTGDTGLKQTSEVNWTNVYLNAEELAVIVPIPEALLDDVDFDIWAEVKPELEEAFAVALDDAIFFGTNKPSSWPSDLATAALAASNVVNKGTSSIDAADDLNNVLKAVEIDGYTPSGWVIRPAFKADLRGLRDSNKNLLWQPAGPANVGIGGKISAPAQIWGLDSFESKAGFASFATSADSTHYDAIAGDWQQGIIGIRQDITYKVLDQAVLTDASGAIVFNLAQQDMVALRAVARFAFAVPNPTNRLQPTAASRYPFALLAQHS